MTPPPFSRPGWLAWAAVGTLWFGVSVTLPWQEGDFRLGLPVRVLAAAAGVLLLLLAARRPRRPDGGITTATGVLGASVLAYPGLLGVTPAGVAGHVLPLTMVQLLPVLTTAQVVGRSRRGWVAAIIGLATFGTALTGLAVAGLIPSSEAVVVVASALWFGSFLLSPAATWTNVRGTSGEVRRRAVVAGLASLLPVVIIVWCASLGVIAAEAGWNEDLAVSALIVGFALGTLACGVLALGADSTPESALLRTRTVVATLHALVGAVIAVLGGAAALLASAAELPAGTAALIGAAVAAVCAVTWLRVHTWASRVVDPAAELRHELVALGEVADGQYRTAVLHVLRRLVGDPALLVEYDPAAAPGPDEHVVLARAEDGVATIVAHASTPVTAARLVRLGDCSPVLRSALLEARVELSAQQAATAAESARDRVRQDLHDGLQGRILGLALNLQLTGRAVDDPTSALVLGETVEALRDLVEDVRALGGGRLPEVLVDEGLGSALAALVRPLGRRITLEVPAVRFAAPTEAVAYFVVSEALANALKHAGAEAISVQIGDPAGGQVCVTVRDDGTGGADPRLGSGLRSLAERVSAAGGVLLVRDGESGGTVVEAVLPCGS